MMKLRRLFFALLTLPLAFAACEHEPIPTPEPEPNMTTVLTLTSEDTLDFTAEGGQGVIEYELVEETRNKPVPMPMVEATCEIDWVTDIAVAEDITFNVASNEGEARATKVVVTYGNQAFEVVVNQAAKAAEPDPKPVYVMDVQLAGAFREPSAEFDKPENYFALSFANDAETIVLGIGLVGAEGDTILKAGNYSSEDSTFDLDLCEVRVWETDTEEDEFIYDGFVKGDVVVELAEEVYSFDITLKDAEDKFYHFTYEGVVMDMEPADKPEPQEFNPVKVEAYRADSWDLGNFELDLYIDDNNYHALDMQDLVNPNDKYLSEGNYTIANGGITSWSNFLWNIETGEGAYVVDAEIALSHNDDGTSTIVGFFESEYGDHLDIDWTGVVTGFVFGGTTPEPPTPGEGDIDVNIYGAGVQAYYYGDWYGVGADLWWVEIYEDDNNKSGRYIQLELLVNPAYEDWRGRFTALNDASTSYFATFVPGEIVDSYLSGAWYVELDNGYISGAYAPILDGTVECVFNEDGSKTIVLDCVDDAGNKIAGTVTSAASAQTYSARTQKNHISLKHSVFAR